MKIFFSYPHGDNAPLVERIKADLEARYKAKVRPLLELELASPELLLLRA